MSETQSIDYLVEKALSVLHNTEIKDKKQDNLQSINLYVTLFINNGIILNTSVQKINNTISETHNEIVDTILENSQETHISVSNEVGNIILENITEVMNKLPDTNIEVENTILENITTSVNKLPDTNIEVENTILENHTSLDTEVTNTILEKITEVMNKLPDTNIEVRHIILENHTSLDTEVTNKTTGINNEVVLEKLSPIPLSVKDILEEVSEKDIKEDWIEVLETKTCDILESVIDNKDYYFVLCPHCSCYVEVLKNSINCKIFRHGCYKTNTQLQIPPHSSKEVCDKLFADGLINGCGKPFKFDGKTVEICDYI